MSAGPEPAVDGRPSGPPAPAGAPSRARIERIELTDVRTFERLRTDLTDGLTILVGPNGVGKTNLLEACAVVLAGASPRTSSELRLVREGAAGCRIHARVAVNSGWHERTVRIELGAGKALRVDGDPVRSVEAYAAGVPSLTFLPERLLVIRGAPARRRALVDGLLTRLSPAAAEHLRAYGRALQQRNVLLRRAKAGRPVGDELVPWTRLLVEHGSELRAARARLLSDLAAPFAERLLQLTGLEAGTFEAELRGGDDLEAAFEAQLPIDQRRGSTTVGPHLDELLPRQAGRDLRAFGSTGEQRAALLAFTIAARDLLLAAGGVEPVLLVDEPWSELDSSRRRRLSDVLLGLGQVIATTTEPPAHLLAVRAGGAAVDVRAVSSGSISPWHDDHDPAADSPTSPT